MDSGWIGVDLDGTLAHYGGWKGPDHIGEPIPTMLARVKKWISEGRTVKIFTARVAATMRQSDAGNLDDKEFADSQKKVISDWCERHIGVRLEVTATKDFGMVELWDDRAVQVVPNHGYRVDGKEDGHSWK